MRLQLQRTLDEEIGPGNGERTNRADYTTSKFVSIKVKSGNIFSMRFPTPSG